MDIIVNPIKTIYNLYGKMKNNNDLCPHILERVTALDKLARFILQKKEEQFSEDVKIALEKLSKLLLSAVDLIEKFNEQHQVAQMVKANNYKAEFDNMNKSLSDAFVTLSGALHVHHEQKVNEQKKMVDEQEKKLNEQEKKLNEQEKKLDEQEKKLDEQEKELNKQDKELDEQKEKLDEQEKKLDEQEEILQRVESKLVYENKEYYCIVQ